MLQMNLKMILVATQAYVLGFCSPALPDLVQRMTGRKARLRAWWVSSELL